MGVYLSAAAAAEPTGPAAEHEEGGRAETSAGTGPGQPGWVQQSELLSLQAQDSYSLETTTLELVETTALNSIETTSLDSEETTTLTR